ncbi:MAG: hypothetical protein HON90_11335 [Halobacteriovoraceae bacterium]|nr:hypothetical protein [Halobacteriovoraceae bacterium]
MLFILSKKGSIGDAVIYSLFIIAPLNSIFGLDIVWDNTYALFEYPKSLPSVGILAIWSVAVGYYHYSKAD